MVLTSLICSSIMCAIQAHSKQQRSRKGRQSPVFDVWHPYTCQFGELIEGWQFCVQVS